MVYVKIMAAAPRRTTMNVVRIMEYSAPAWLFFDIYTKIIYEIKVIFDFCKYRDDRFQFELFGRFHWTCLSRQLISTDD